MFGRRVFVTAQVFRVENGSYYNFAQAGRLLNPRKRKVWLGGDGWPGEPVHVPKLNDGYELEPGGKGQVRLRRFPEDPAIPGVVIGETWLQEGEIDQGYSDEPTAFYSTRRIRVEQVALPPNGSTVCIVATCLVEDLVDEA
jgi:hypothetical protein